MTSSDYDYVDPINNNTDIGDQQHNCSLCLNELCLSEVDYDLYKSWVSVDTYELVLITLNVVVFLTGVVGNSLDARFPLGETFSGPGVDKQFANYFTIQSFVFIAVTTTKSMQSVTNIFIVNLALADILVMLFCAPPSIIWDVTNTWVFGSLMCRIVIYIQDVSVSVSVLTLTFIAYDRYHAICRPLQFASKRTKAFVVIGAIWSISGMIGIPDAITLKLVSPFKDAPCRTEEVLFDLSSCSPSWSEEFDFFFTLLKAVLLYTLPLIFMSVAYYHIVKTLWRRNNLHGGQESQENSNGMIARSAAASSRKNISRADSTSDHHQQQQSYRGGSVVQHSANRALDNQLRTRRKVAKMLIAVVIMFSINFFPVHLLPIVNFIVDRTLTPDSPAHEKISQVLMYAGIITHCMCYFNSAINPIIYYFMSAQFKAQYRRIISCRCSADTPSPKNPRNLLEASNGAVNAAETPAGGSRGGVTSRHLRSRSCLGAPPQNCSSSSRASPGSCDFKLASSASTASMREAAKRSSPAIGKADTRRNFRHFDGCNELQVPLTMSGESIQQNSRNGV